MAKRGALSKVEKFYIEGNIDLPIEEIAAELDRTVNSIQKHIDGMTNVKSEAAPEPTETSKPKETQMMKIMGRHERNGQKVATVMTKAASELSDAQRPRRVMNKKIQEAIHKPCG